MTDFNSLLSMRIYFDEGGTKSYRFRRQQLLRLKEAVTQYEPALQQALYTDLKKSAAECWATETGFLLSEINHTLKYLKRWMQPERVPTNLLNFPSKSYILQEPLGVVLIIGSWNYPLQLLLTPLVGAIAAGNCAVLKASEFAPATAAVIKKLIGETFDKNYIQLVEGEGAIVIPQMMQHFRFDHIFYTGGIAAGKNIYAIAAKDVIPVTLELGGKSPCIVESDANIRVTAKRIALAKFSNAGQMCVAPDYVLVHASKKEQLTAALKKSIVSFFGEQAEKSEDYGKIINEKHFDRLVQYLDKDKIVYGGGIDRSQLYIEPTILHHISLDDLIMQEEIFGPLLPLISFDTKEEAASIIRKNSHPLALYVFTSSKKKQQQWLTAIPFGGGCINNTALHLTNHHLPFGGRGFSGFGHYHGKYSFDTFSHKKAVLHSPTWFDPALKYPPYQKKLKWFKWLIR